MTNQEFSPLRWQRPSFLQLSPLVWLFALSIAIASWVWWPQGGNDWRDFFAVAARNWWPDPWSHLADFPYMPWTGLLLSPLGGLPERASTTITNSLAVIIFARAAKRLGGPDWVVLPVLLSPPGYWLFRNGQVEWLAVSGLLMFNGLDLILLVIKPQVAIGVIVPRLKRARGQWLRYLAPVAIAGIVSLLVWPGWPVRALPDPTPHWIKASWNWSIWPWGIPVAIFLLWRAWQTSEDWLGVVASPLLSPYVNMPNYLGLMLALAARWPRVALAVWAAMWITALAWYLSLSP